MKKIQINWMDLETAFEQIPDDFSGIVEMSSYFDKESGQVIVVDETMSDAVQQIMDELDEGGNWTEEDIRGTESYAAVAEWLKPSVLAAIQLDYGASLDRFERIPGFDSHKAFQWMEDFAVTVADEMLRAQLTSALQQRKPFHNFRDAIGTDRRLRQQWRAFELARRREAVIDWLASIDVEPFNSDESTYNLPALPELRKIMFAEVRRFVRLARDIAGVQRIALIGSLATDKEFPKDIDMLTTISGDCDLTELATLGRQLKGHMAAHGAGADVFLANPHDAYLGRTCSWKECGPGIRMSCDAKSCGVRHYLHDDFSSIRLKKALIQDPPVRLWPEIAADSTVPPDVLEQLIQPLSEDPLR